MFFISINSTFNAGQGVQSVNTTRQADGMPQFSGTIADDASNFHIVLPIVRANMKALIIVCNQDLTIKTNDSGTPDDTLDIMGADGGLIWLSGTGSASPLENADVTDLYVTNEAGVECELSIYALQDITP